MGIADVAPYLQDFFSTQRFIPGNHSLFRDSVADNIEVVFSRIPM